eukprot:403336929
MFSRLFTSSKKKSNNHHPQYGISRASTQSQYSKSQPLHIDPIYEDEGFAQEQKIKLPVDFARQVIKLEIQCERPDAQKIHVNQLTDLYANAIEYYNTKSDYSNQQFYQNKLQSLLTRNDIQTIAGIAEEEQEPEEFSDMLNGAASRGFKQRSMTMQEKRDKQISKKKLNDALQLEIYNYEKENAKEIETKLQEKLDDSKQEETLRVMKVEQHKQSEQFRKRLADRKRNINMNRSMNLRDDLSNGLITKNTSPREDRQHSQEDDDKFGHSLMIHQSKLSAAPRMSVQIKGNQKFSSTQSMFSTGQKSSNSLSLGGGIAGRLTSHIQSLIFNSQNVASEIRVEDYNDLINLVEELNKCSDIQVKLSNLIKMCKVLETNDDQFFFENQPIKVEAVQENQSLDLDPENSQIIAEKAQESPNRLMEKCRDALQKLVDEKDKEIEEFLEKLSEEKFAKNQEIKMKYQKMINMLKNSKDPSKEEKIQNYETKKSEELEAYQREFNDLKNTGIKQIKDKFNESSLNEKIDSQLYSELLKQSLQKANLHIINGGSPIRTRLQQANSQKFEQQIYGLDALNNYQNQHRESTGYIGQHRR